MKKPVLLLLSLLFTCCFPTRIFVYASEPLSVTVTPTGVTLNINQSITFVATGRGGREPYIYVWILDGNIVDNRVNYTYTASARGNHTLYVRIIDDAQEQGRSNDVQIIITTTPTTFSVTELTLEPLSYKPTRITFNYEYTDIHTIGSITTIGHGDYIHSGGPTFLEFIAKDIDDYSFMVELQYTNATKQTVLIGLISGTMSVQGMGLTGYSEVFRINVRLKVTEQPSYPSKEELAREYFRLTEENVVEHEAAIRQMMEDQKTTNLMVSILVVVCLVLVVVCFVVVGSLYRARRHV